MGIRSFILCLFMVLLAATSQAKSTLIALSGHSFEVSVLSEAQAQTLFKMVAANPSIPYQYLRDGCYAIAHKLTLLFEETGVIAGKVHVSGALRYLADTEVIKWEFHVAAFIVVEKTLPSGTVVEEVFVIDPATADRAVPLEEWLRSMSTLPGSRVDQLYFTKRFNYLPPDDVYDMTSYDEADRENMEKTLHDYSEALRK